jgi:4-amino-4-deoxy-L-arabinose transferase-like glycosyltransferase
VDKNEQIIRDMGWSTDFYHKIHIMILVAVTLVIGIYFISTTVLIAKDSVLYIEIAKKIFEGLISTVDNTVQAPGYPVLIYLMHKATGLFCDAQSLQGWIVSAQVVSLLSKLIATIVLYFIGNYFMGPRLSFWGVLILSLLPDSVDYGSDALNDWPNIMFLALGFGLLLLGVQYHKSWIYGCSGIVAGLGYLTRPECGQLILYGSAWLVFNLIRPQNRLKRSKAAVALVLLLAAFAVIAVPYALFKGYIFPEQQILKIPAWLSLSSIKIDSTLNMNPDLAGLLSEKITGSLALMSSICEILMYYFIPALLIGSHSYFRKQSKGAEQAFFAAAFIIVNVAMIGLWQQLYNGPLSKRYALPLVAFTVFYIPIGLNIIACWLSSRNTSTNKVDVETNIQRWFFILMAVGIGICAVKLVRMVGKTRISRYRRLAKQKYGAYGYYCCHRSAYHFLRESEGANDIC